MFKYLALCLVVGSACAQDGLFGLPDVELLDEPLLRQMRATTDVLEWTLIAAKADNMHSACTEVSCKSANTVGGCQAACAANGLCNTINYNDASNTCCMKACDVCTVNNCALYNIEAISGYAVYTYVQAATGNGIAWSPQTTTSTGVPSFVAFTKVVEIKVQIEDPCAVLGDAGLASIKASAIAALADSDSANNLLKTTVTCTAVQSRARRAAAEITIAYSFNDAADTAALVADTVALKSTALGYTREDGTSATGQVASVGSVAVETETIILSGEDNSVVLAFAGAKLEPSTAEKSSITARVTEDLLSATSLTDGTFTVVVGYDAAEEQIEVTVLVDETAPVTLDALRAEVNQGIADGHFEIELHGNSIASAPATTVATDETTAPAPITPCSDDVASSNYLSSGRHARKSGKDKVAKAKKDKAPKATTATPEGREISESPTKAPKAPKGNKKSQKVQEGKDTLNVVALTFQLEYSPAAVAAVDVVLRANLAKKGILEADITSITYRLGPIIAEITLVSPEATTKVRNAAVAITESVEGDDFEAAGCAPKVGASAAEAPSESGNAVFQGTENGGGGDPGSDTDGSSAVAAGLVTGLIAAMVAIAVLAVAVRRQQQAASEDEHFDDPEFAAVQAKVNGMANPMYETETVHEGAVKDDFDGISQQLSSHSFNPNKGERQWSENAFVLDKEQASVRIKSARRANPLFLTSVADVPEDAEEGIVA